MTDYLLGYKYKVEDQGKTFLLKINDSMFKDDCWEKFEFEENPTKEFEL